MTKKIAVVTGASGGIGRALVLELVRLGYGVHALALADQYLDELRSLEGVSCHPIDVCDGVAVAHIVQSLEVDVLINNAGIIGELQAAQRYSAPTADAIIDINLRSAIQTTLAVLPGMVACNRGHIVFTGSIAGTRPTANTAVYSATKAGLSAFADGLRMDLFGTAIRVTLLAPGRVETRLYDQALGGPEQAAARMYAGAAAIQPSEIAELVGVVLSMPSHVDVTRLEVVPTAQVYGGSQI